jgi:hypothetical protein
MPFDNFYNESDKAAKRWRKGLILGFCLLVIYFIVGSVLLSRHHEIEPPRRQPESERIDHLVALYNELPKPENFNFVMQNPPISYKNGTAIVFRFQSDREIDEITPPFLVWFNTHGWSAVPDSELTFTNGAQTISIRMNYSDFANYELYCYEKEKVFE